MVKFGGKIGTLYQMLKNAFKKHPLQNRTNVQIKGGGGSKAFWTMFKKTSLFPRDGFPNALYMKSSNLDKIRVFIRNVSCTKCPKNRPFLRSQITVWLYKVWVCLSIKTKGFSKFTFVDHQMFKVRVSLYFKTNFVKRLLKVDHRWSPDVLILLIGWAAAWENLQWALNPFLTPGENSVCV